MRRYLALCMVCFMLVLVGCSSLSTSDSLQNQPVAKDSKDLINYSNLDYKEGEVLVKTSNSAALEQLVVDKGSEVLKRFGNTDWNLLSVPQGKSTLSFMEELKEEKSILLVEPNLSYEPPQEVSSEIKFSEMTIQQTSSATDYYKWGLDAINAEAAWDITTGDPNVIVAVISTGVDTEHPEFSDKTFIGDYDATGEGRLDTDLNGWGTFTAAIAAADGASGKIAGVAWESPIMPIRAMDSNGYIQTSYLIDAMTYAADYIEAHSEYRMVVNIHSAGRGYSFALKDAIDYALEKGVVVVAPVGSDNMGGKRALSYPAAYNGVIAVSSSNPHGEKSNFSNKGSYLSLAAPGERIYSAYIFTDVYAYLNGPIASSAYVTGAAALLLAENPELTPLEVQNQLEATAKGTGFSEELGYGILDLEALLGEIKSMKYGGLEVTTNIIPANSTVDIGRGIVTVFDANNDILRGYGTTGEAGNHQFPALTPGDYRVNVSFYDPFKESYDIQAKNVTVTADGMTTADLTLAVPTEVNKEDLIKDYLLDGRDYDSSSVEFPFTIISSGSYQFITKQYDNIQVDTVIWIFDATGDLIFVRNEGRYENVIVNLEPGDYTLLVSNADEYEVMVCFLDIFSIEVIYD